jgi:hypothetical protein
MKAEQIVRQRRGRDDGRRRQQETSRAVAPPQPTNATLNRIDALLEGVGHRCLIPVCCEAPIL